jgi:hypothetical protein
MAVEQLPSLLPRKGEGRESRDWGEKRKIWEDREERVESVGRGLRQERKKNTTPYFLSQN